MGGLRLNNSLSGLRMAFLIYMIGALVCPPSFADSVFQKRIQGAKYDWVDPSTGQSGAGRDPSSIDGGLTGAGSVGRGGAAGNGAGSSSGNGGVLFGSGAGKRGGLLAGATTDSNGATKKGAGKGSDFSDTGSVPRAVLPEGAEKSGAKAEVFDLFWPMCMFIDAGVPAAQGNAAVKGMIEKAAACKVNVQVFPITIKGGKTGAYNNKESEINEASSRDCNLPGSLGGFGSSTVLVPWDDTAGEMCQVPDKDDKGKQKIGPDGKPMWDTNVLGCAEVRQGGEHSTRDKHQHRDARGKVATSIEVPKGWNDFVVSHEAIGHNMMGRPNGNRYGMGIGEDDDFDPTKGGDAEGDGENQIGSGGAWTQSPKKAGWESGCAVMRKMASPNTGRFGFDASRQTYWVKQENPALQYDLLRGQPLFGPNNPPPPPGKPTVPPIFAGGPRIGIDDKAKPAVLSPGASSPGKAVTQIAPGETRHKRGAGADGAAGKLLNSLATATEGDGSDDSYMPAVGKLSYARNPANVVVVGSTAGASIGIDDSAKQGNLSGGQKPAASSSPSPGSGAGKPSLGSSIGIDDSARQANLSGAPAAKSISTPSAGGGGGAVGGGSVSGGGGIGIDDSAGQGNLSGKAGAPGAGGVGGVIASAAGGKANGLSDSASFFSGEKDADSETEEENPFLRRKRGGTIVNERRRKPTLSDVARRNGGNQ